LAEDLRVVAPANFPEPTPSPLRIVRLGGDLRDVLRRGLTFIDAQCRGLAPQTPREIVTAVFEHEWKELS
jgi:hypothetical protein